MPARKFRARRDFPAPIQLGYERLLDELEVPTSFGDDVLAEADLVAQRGYDTSWGHIDLTDVDFVTIDPPGSKDLDQAMCIRPRGDGFVVQYAIADVAAWVKPGGAIDLEAQRRGQTLYSPHHRWPLHPPALSERAASLLADGTPRPALVWTIELDGAGDSTSVRVERALVRSRAQLDYPAEQDRIDAGTADPTIMALRRVGELRQQVEAARGGISLDLPDQEVDVEGDRWTLEFRSPLPNEGWNAQISLLTGFSAATLMLDAGVGILRTLPPADRQTIDSLRTVAASLGLSWRKEESYADFVRSLDSREPAGHAMMMSCVRLFRGAGYTVITPGLTPDQTVHAALAANYTHCTAPLRRLVDRYTGEIALAISAGTTPAAWAAEALDGLPELMGDSDRKAKAFERGVNDLVEALVLEHRRGETFGGVVIQVDGRKNGEGIVSIADPAIEAKISGPGVKLGAQVRATLTEVDLTKGLVRFGTR